MLGAVGFLLAGHLLRAGEPQLFRTICACIGLNPPAFPFNLAPSEVFATIHVHTPSAWYVPVQDIAMAFLSGLAATAINLGFHGAAWLTVSVVIDYALRN